MPRTMLMTFDEFQTSWDAAENAAANDALRQQREFLREVGSADAILQPGTLPALGWAEWPAA